MSDLWPEIKPKPTKQDLLSENTSSSIKFKIGSTKVEFGHTAVNKNAHLFIGMTHDPVVCPECIRPNTLSFANTKADLLSEITYLLYRLQHLGEESDRVRAYRDKIEQMLNEM